MTSAHRHYRLYVHITWPTWRRVRSIRAWMLPDVAAALRIAGGKTAVRVLRHAVLTEHVHVLLGFRPNSRLSDFVQYAKSISSRRVNERHPGGLKWARGYYAGTLSPDAVPTVSRYLARQYQHHPDRIPG